ncbi:11223_t:CDS:2 [Gigaspora margarita]|uniref:11223_t:CDS:1 n=1 Tax=Gigaspora margarita TaxID=4874 RepID=A0ABN7V6C0_GIGMA|nr:11223_t:CDS:2 [Gigaspora margarita]
MWTDQNEQPKPGQTEQNKQMEKIQLQKIFLPVPLNRIISIQKALALKILFNLSSLKQQPELPQSIKGEEQC